MQSAWICAWAQYAPANPEWNQPLEPFNIVGNIYYVGAHSVSSYLITTPEGHILLDTGFRETVPLIEANVVKLGFKMEDIRILVATHAHYDHAGGLADVKSKTKARLLLNPVEVEPFARGGKDDFAFGDRYAFPPVEGDGLLQDGEPIRLGGTALIPQFTPGHTKGCTSYTMAVREGDNTYNVVFACSLTAPDYQLVDNPKYPEIVQDYEKTFAKLGQLPCDVHLGGHRWEFGMAEKLAILERGGGGNPFVDPEGYKRFLDRSQAAFGEQLKEQRSGAR